jgi:hypothetical protein
VRLSLAKFFSPGTGGLVEGGIEPDPNEAVLNCYRLADRFKQNPAVFLQMPLSEIGWHMDYTIKLIEAQRAARAREDDE